MNNDYNQIIDKAHLEITQEIIHIKNIATGKHSGAVLSDPAYLEWPYHDILEATKSLIKINKYKSLNKKIIKIINKRTKNNIKENARELHVNSIKLLNKLKKDIDKINIENNEIITAEAPLFLRNLKWCIQHIKRKPIIAIFGIVVVISGLVNGYNLLKRMIFREKNEATELNKADSFSDKYTGATLGNYDIGKRNKAQDIDVSKRKIILNDVKKEEVSVKINRMLKAVEYNINTIITAENENRQRLTEELGAKGLLYGGSYFREHLERLEVVQGEVSKIYENIKTDVEDIFFEFGLSPKNFSQIQWLKKEYNKYNETINMVRNKYEFINKKTEEYLLKNNAADSKIRKFICSYTRKKLPRYYE